MKKYIVNYTASFDYSVEVEAENKEQAREIADANLPSFDSDEWCNGGVECWAVDEV